MRAWARRRRRSGWCRRPRGRCSGTCCTCRRAWARTRTSPGTLFGDLLFMPTRVGEDQTPAPGYIQAFNVRTGTLGWVFRTMPYPTDPGYETWSRDAYKNTDVGSAICWAG